MVRQSKRKQDGSEAILSTMERRRKGEEVEGFLNTIETALCPMRNEDGPLSALASAHLPFE
jgi:hypothetical protein